MPKSLARDIKGWSNASIVYSRRIQWTYSDVWVISDISMLKPSVQLLLIVVQAFPARKEGGEGRLTAASKMNAFTDLIYHAYGYTSTPTSFSLACSKRDIKRERVSRSLGIFVNCPNLGSGDSDFSCHCTKLWVAAADVDSEAVFEKRMFKREKHLK